MGVNLIQSAFTKWCLLETILVKWCVKMKVFLTRLVNL
ncbi:hypothetical protein [Psychroserpens sp.]